MSSSLSFHSKQQNSTQDDILATSLPSPPHSSCGEDNLAHTLPTSFECPAMTTTRRDSLPSHFSTMTLLSHSLPENYTIDHSSNLKPTVAKSTKPYPRRSSIQDSPSAAAAGGLTIRHRRPSRKDLSYRCDDCGKVYKHPSCLTKHRWEHSEEWELTSKLPLTKHQQVQMLEAAAILVGMDHRHQPSDDDESIHVDDDDDDDISIEMDQDPSDQVFPSMIGSTPAMLPASFVNTI
ncbi:hypothetical protein [Absidia glauca]|uniref:C2H2-type domain-containing protein n=1 Tax=Absidia glauca TaxID=4829 RepID=A0A163JY79_ABSGL|nr:hypothetical protein [Absidia glauca]